MPNTYKNKVVYNGTTLIDLTSDTVTPSALAEGYTAHDASGAPITGTATGGSMVIRDEQDSHGGTIRSITAGSVVTGTKAITANGTYDVAEFADASVNVPSAEPELQAKTATPSTSQQVITADSGYDGLSQVTVSAMPSGSATTPTTSITANPSISVNSSTGLITASVSGSKSVTPSVSAGYVSSGTAGTVSVSGSNTSQLTTQAAKTVTPSTSSQTAVAAGRYTTGAVTVEAMPSGTAGTPSATKGTVSNHSVSVTPSVTNATGYITGGTKTGTAVTVSASELVSGSQTITENGTVDVTNLASVDVEVAGGGGDDSNFAHTISRSGAITSIPSDITSIGEYVFYGCTGLTISSLPSGVTSIGKYAFRDCSSMPLSSLPSGITLINTYTFYGCDLLTVSTLPDGVTYIGANAFQNCPSMTSIQCSGRISTLGGSSFLGSSAKPSSLRSVKFPNAVISSSLSTVFGSSTAANACQQLEEADIGSVASIAVNAFANCYKLQTLVLRRTANFTGLANVSAFTNTPLSGYNGLTGTVYVPSALISSYQTANNWSTLYNDGTVTFAAIEGSEYEL